MTVFRSKHQKLILRCYPAGKGVDKKPNSSELSYLLYYASTRRIKLEKVSVFLEKKTVSDCYRSRLGNLEVTLCIIDALIERCSENLNVFASAVCSILKKILLIGDIALARHLVRVYGNLCKKLDGGLFSGDVKFVDNFSDLTEKLIGVKKETLGTKNPNALDWGLISITSSKHLFNCLSYNSKLTKKFIYMCIPLLTDVIHSSNSRSSILVRVKSKMNVEDGNTSKSVKSFSGKIMSQTSKNPSDSDTDPVDHDKLNEEAFNALSNLFNTTSINQIAEATRSILDYLQKQAIDIEWGSAYVDMYTTLIPVQLRFVTLSTVLQDLVAHSKKSCKSKPLYTTQKQLASYVLGLISSDVNLIGLSISDITQQLLSLQTNMVMEQSKHLSQLEVDDIYNLYSRCIENLSTHIYYVDQVPDSIQEIFLQIDNLVHSSNLGESNSKGSVRLINGLLDNIKRIFSDLETKPSSIQRSHVTLEHWNSSLFLFNIGAHEEDKSQNYMSTSESQLIQLNYLETFKVFLAKEFVDTDDLIEVGSSGNKDLSKQSVDPDYNLYISEAENFLSVMFLNVNSFLSQEGLSQKLILELCDVLRSLCTLLGINFFYNFLPVFFGWQFSHNNHNSNEPAQVKDNMGYCLLFYSMRELEKTYSLKYVLSSPLYRLLLNSIQDRIDHNIWLDVLKFEDLKSELNNLKHMEGHETISVHNVTSADIEEFVIGNDFMSKYIPLNRMSVSGILDPAFSGSIELTNQKSMNNMSQNSFMFSERSTTKASILGLGNSNDVLSIHSGILQHNLLASRFGLQDEEGHLDSSLNSFYSDSGKSVKTPRVSDLKNTLSLRQKFSPPDSKDPFSAVGSDTTVYAQKKDPVDVSAFLSILDLDDELVPV